MALIVVRHLYDRLGSMVIEAGASLEGNSQEISSLGSQTTLGNLWALRGKYLVL